VRRTKRAAVKLRRARRSDLDGLDALEREIFKSRLFSGHLLSRTSFRRLLASPRATFIVAQADELAGYVLVLYRARSRAARMYSIGVAVKFRGRGLARMLVAAAEKDAIRRRCTAMRLEVRADSRGTIALYERAGYRSIGRAPGYYGDRVDALRLEKPFHKEPRNNS
jgi:[ribosomal protein S18]-alanine N-acetyltransferase